MAALGLKIPKALTKPTKEETTAPEGSTIDEWQQHIIETHPPKREIQDFIVALNKAYGDCNTRSARIKVGSIRV